MALVPFPGQSDPKPDDDEARLEPIDASDTSGR